jgi:hypothetical protein
MTLRGKNRAIMLTRCKIVDYQKKGILAESSGTFHTDTNNIIPAVADILHITAITNST